MALAALIFAILACLLALATFVMVLLLLGGRESRFVKWRTFERLRKQVWETRSGQSDLWRYLEAIDDATGGTGHKVFLVGQGLSGDDPLPRKR